MREQGVDVTYTAYYNFTGVHALPIVINLISNALSRASASVGGEGSWDNPDVPFISVANYPLPNSNGFDGVINSFQVNLSNTNTNTNTNPTEWSTPSRRAPLLP